MSNRIFLISMFALLGPGLAGCGGSSDGQSSSSDTESTAPSEPVDESMVITSGDEAAISPEEKETTEVALSAALGDLAERCSPTEGGAPPYSRLFIPVVNDEALAFTLPSARGPEYSLASFRADKNLVLVFYRAFWCTSCRAQLEDLATRYTEFQDLDAVVLAISTDNLEDAGYVVDEVGVPFPVLFDTEASTPLDYGVFNLWGDELATTSTLILS